MLFADGIRLFFSFFGTRLFLFQFAVAIFHPFRNGEGRRGAKHSLLVKFATHSFIEGRRSDGVQTTIWKMAGGGVVANQQPIGPAGGKSSTIHKLVKSPVK